MINDILNKYLNNEKTGIVTTYTLDGILTLLYHLQNPHMNFKSVHIAGTNGKGSTAVMLAAILERSGYKTGLYTSPHLVKINERIKINSIDIDDTLLYKYLEIIDVIIQDGKSFYPTYFDILTAAAFKYFSDEKVDIAIIETGLGGRLDSTNVVAPEITVITDISLDHVGILGNKLSDITKEKCGIIKKNSTVVTTNTDSEILNIIEKYSNDCSSILYSYNKNYFSKNIRRVTDQFVFDYMSDLSTLTDIRLSLFPVHQIKNASAVITTLLLLRSNGFPEISDQIIYTGLDKIQVPGRFQMLHSDPLIIYDPAHNYDALNNLINGLEIYYPDKKKKFILSMMKDKADNKTLDLLKNSDSIYYLLNDERAYIADENKFKLIVSDKNIIIDILQKINKDEYMIVFTGTFRIYEDALYITQILKNGNSQDRS